MNPTAEALIAETIASIRPTSARWLAEARTHLDVLTKPLGSLGRLEDIAAQVASIQNKSSLDPLQKAVYVFAADHGVSDEGVSAYPREVTQQMVLNFLKQGAAINVLARLHHVEMFIVDVGVDADFSSVEGLLNHKVRRGSRNMLHEAAMSDEEMAQAIRVGLQLAANASLRRHNLVAAGEMGIGNTTAASAITSILTGSPTSLVTGKGTGLDSHGCEHKRKIIEAILQERFLGFGVGNAVDPLDVLQRVGGLEIAAITGFILGAAQYGIAIVVDGFISTAAAAIAFAIEPRIGGYLFAGHQSEEPGHRVLLEYMKLKPILSLSMRLGEGTGAVLAMPIIQSAVCLYSEMATFASAGVSEAKL